MNIGLIDVDSHNFPNLALMKISAYHKRMGDSVEMWNALQEYDIVYKSKIFTFTDDIQYPIRASKIVGGGTGYNDSVLPQDIEHECPDYELYPQYDGAYGFLTRGCPRNCGFCIVGKKEGLKSVQVADIDEFWRGQKVIHLLDPNILACKDHERLLESLIKTKAFIDINQGLDARLINKDNLKLIEQLKIKMLHFAWDNPEDEQTPKKLGMLKGKFHKGNAVVYVLTNYNSTEEQDLMRIYRIKEMGFSPYLMIYDKPHASKRLRQMARWVNNRYVFAACDKWEDYERSK